MSTASPNETRTHHNRMQILLFDYSILFYFTRTLIVHEQKQLQAFVPMENYRISSKFIYSRDRNALFYKTNNNKLILYGLFLSYFRPVVICVMNAAVVPHKHKRKVLWREESPNKRKTHMQSPPLSS